MLEKTTGKRRAACLDNRVPPAHPPSGNHTRTHESQYQHAQRTSDNKLWVDHKKTMDTARRSWRRRRRCTSELHTAGYMAYLCVQSFASWLYRSLSVLYMRAISGTRGSSGFGSVSSEQMDSRTITIQHDAMSLFQAAWHTQEGQTSANRQTKQVAHNSTAH